MIYQEYCYKAKQLMEKLAFPVDSIFYFHDCLDQIENQGLDDYLIETVKLYEANINIDYEILADRANKISSSSNIHVYSIFIILFLFMSNRLFTYYESNNISIEKFYETLNDLKYKIVECKLVKGVWGTFVSYWELFLFRGEIIGFGCLQFELITLNRDVTYKDKTILKGEKVLSVHIPRREKKLDIDEVRKEIDEAMNFYKGIITKNVIVLDSWLIHPTTVSCLSKDSNIRKFLSLFNYIDKRDAIDYSELWRLFDMEVNEETYDLLPTNTSLRRNFVDVIKNKISFGDGYGVLFYDNI